MSEDKKVPGEDTPPQNNRPGKGNEGGAKVIRIPGALLFWVVLLLIFCGMYFWKGSGAQKIAQWDESQFKKRIADKIIG